jgi:glucose 1-dehydrogenase
LILPARARAGGQGRVADPEEVASIAVSLALQDASYITGETIDGSSLVLNHTAPVPRA